MTDCFFSFYVWAFQEEVPKCGGPPGYSAQPGGSMLGPEKLLRLGTTRATPRLLRDLQGLPDGDRERKRGSKVEIQVSTYAKHEPPGCYHLAS